FHVWEAHGPGVAQRYLAVAVDRSEEGHASRSAVEAPGAAGDGHGFSCRRNTGAGRIGGETRVCDGHRVTGGGDEMFPDGVDVAGAGKDLRGARPRQVAAHGTDGVG